MWYVGTVGTRLVGLGTDMLTSLVDHSLMPSCSSIARSQTTSGHCTHLFLFLLFGVGGGGEWAGGMLS